MIILMAGDTEDIRLLLKLMLEHKGHCVAEAANGRQAVETANCERSDVILLDLNMPVMCGSEATRYLREQPETSDIPIISVTAYCGNPNLRRSAMVAGCIECIGKPVDLLFRPGEFLRYVFFSASYFC